MLRIFQQHKTLKISLLNASYMQQLATYLTIILYPELCNVLNIKQL